MTTTEIVRFGATLVVVLLLGGCGLRINRNRPAWRLVVPIMLWAANYAIFLAALWAVPPEIFRLYFNWWGQIIMMHAAVTFMLYLLVMRAGRGGRSLL